LVVFHAFTLALSHLVDLLLVHNLGDLAVGASHLLLDFKVSWVHAFAAATLYRLVGSHQLLVVITRLVLASALGEVLVRVEGRLIGLIIQSNEFITRHLLGMLQ